MSGNGDGNGNRFLGPTGRWLRFVALLAGVLMSASTVTCLVLQYVSPVDRYRLPLIVLALASGVVAAWSLSLYHELNRQELLDDLRRAADPTANDADRQRAGEHDGS